MIFRIFKKDWKLLWPLVLLVAFAHAMSEILWLIRDGGNVTDELLIDLSKFLPLIAALGSAILSLSVVQADPIPGDREDWLTRPIRHADLLMAKLLFVLLAVAAPVLAVSAGKALFEGFSFADALDAGFWRSVALLVQACLPAMILGSICRNATEVIVSAAGVVAVASAVAIFLTVTGAHQTLGNTGLSWWMSAVVGSIIAAAALIILPLQYFGRHTFFSRLLALVFLLLASPGQFLPWSNLFAVQQALASDRHSGDNVTISYDPGQSRSSRTAIAAGVRGPASLINLPIRADGVPGGDILFADRAEIRLITDGKMIYHEPHALTIWSISAFANAPTLLRQGPTDGRPLHGYQAILFPTSLLSRFRGRNVTLEIDYSLSLFRQDASANVAALDDNKHLEKIGWCKTALDDDGDAAELTCAQTGQGSNCLSAVLENPATGQRDPEFFKCEPDYSPVAIHFIPDVVTHFGVELPFRESGNDAKYPVGESQIGKARVAMTSYQPSGHFTRRLVISNIRLGDWEAETSQAQASVPRLNL